MKDCVHNEAFQSQFMQVLTCQGGSRAGPGPDSNSTNERIEKVASVLSCQHVIIVKHRSIEKNEHY